ncbi:MAG: DUF58 domain-containing protein [Planctomycetales bacterium]|nr:DUF58 domain-containing protein [Planctomycetales bacterium]
MSPIVPCGVIDWMELQQHVWIFAVLMTLPLLLLASWQKIYPTKRMLSLALVPTAMTLAAFVGHWALPIVLGADIVALAIVLADLFLVPPRTAFSATRETGRIASITKRHAVTLRLTNHLAQPLLVDIKDDLPEAFGRPEEFRLRLDARSRATVRYSVKPRRRGAFTMRSIYLRTTSRLGFWIRLIEAPAESVVHVYPDMQQLAEYAVLARTNRLSLLGVRRTRHVGQDNEFERLRDYTLDDNYKHIDWRSTARRNKLTVKDFQTNQSQQVVFMIDCGRMMTNESDGISLLDHALNSMLMLSYVALQKGDAVGLICFSDQVHTFVPPKSGMSQMNRLLHASFDRFPQLVESRYDEAFLYLATRCKRRALVMLMTNVIDDVNSNQIQSHLTTLVGRHLPAVAMLRDERLFDAADAPHVEGADFYRAGAAAEVITWRHQVLRDLERSGVLALDARPSDMTAEMVNRYLQVKARHLL